MPRYTVAAPSYLKRYGRPTHPMHLAEHKCFGYAYLSTAGVWHYTNAAGEQASVRPAGQLRVNNGEALLPSVIAASASPTCRTSSSAMPLHPAKSR